MLETESREYSCSSSPVFRLIFQSLIISLKFLLILNYFQCRRCPHYFLPSVDLFRGKSPAALDNAAKLTWGLLRELLTNSSALESL